MKISILTDIRQGGLIFTLGILFLGLSTTAFGQVQKEERQAPPMEQLPQEQSQVVVSYEDEIKKDEMPKAIISSINENYPDYKISEAYRGSDGSYKVKLDANEKKIAAFYDADGEFLRIEHDKSEETINDDWR